MARSVIFIVNFEHISHLALVFLLLTLNMSLTAGISPFLTEKWWPELESRGVFTIQLNISTIADLRLGFRYPSFNYRCISTYEKTE